MKRCPQCEFIYEDDQSYCDMDGARLTHDSHPLPKLQALTAGEVPAKSSWRNRVVPIMAALILTSVLGLVYYVSISQSARRSTTVVVSPVAKTASDNVDASSASNASQKLSSETDAKINPQTTPAVDANTTTEARPSVGNDSKKPEEKSSTKPTEQKVKSKQQAQVSNRSSANAKPAEKQESKVRSALRKTGRFLKKKLSF
jgi:hypothetical protein